MLLKMLFELNRPVQNAYLKPEGRCVYPELSDSQLATKISEYGAAAENFMA